jgi:beta-glucosidase
VTVDTEALLDSRIRTLTLEQKVRLLTGADWWTLPPEPAVGLRRLTLSDGPVGVRGTAHDDTDPSANLPSASAIAATWDTTLVARLARLLAAEARRKGVDVLLGPTVNLHRSPRGGRHFECYSEDPLLTARLGTAYVRALQASGVGATVKHYVANDSETERFTVDVRVDERTLREVYLRPFEDLVRDGGAWAVMAAYNSVNGTTMTEHPLLAEPLKGEWGFDGVVVSDWLAARTTVATAAGGLDLVMPPDNSPWGEDLVAAVRASRVDEAAVDDKVRRLLRLASRVGALDGVPPPPGPTPVPPGQVRPGQVAALLREAAAAGTVLLANRAGTLPLPVADLASVAVIGPHALEPRTQGGGSAEVHPPYAVSPLDGLRAALAGRAAVTGVAGCRLVEGLVPVAPPLAANPRTGEPGVLVELVAGDGTVLRRADRRSGRLWFTTGELPPGTVQVRVSTRLRADGAGRWRFGFSGIGQFSVDVDGQRVLHDMAFPDGPIMEAFADPPQHAVARTLATGDEVDLVMTYDVPPGMPVVTCVLGAERPPADPVAELARAVDAARAADAAVVVVGTTERVETEGVDRRDLALPGDQDELVRAVAAANPRTVVVVNAGAPVLMPWRDQVAAVLLAWFGGQEMGNAVADVLLGLAEPGGRLPTTWPAAEADVPVLATDPAGGRLEYAEGIHVGYRAWLRSGAVPAYPFGHGLGYTDWVYEALAVDGMTARVRLRNAGGRPGKEVVQAYLSLPAGGADGAGSADGAGGADGAVERPVRWLAGFAVVRAGPGEAVTADVPLDPRSFAHWSVGDRAWVTGTGGFTLAVGRSALDLRLTAEIPAR